MPDTIIKSVQVNLDASDNSAPVMNTFEARVMKLADNMAKPPASHEDMVQAAIDRRIKTMENAAIKFNEAEARLAAEQDAKMRMGLMQEVNPAQSEWLKMPPEGARTAGADIGREMAESTSESFMENLKGQFGRGSFATEAIHALRGAGPLLAAGLAAHELDELTIKAVQLKQQFAEGNLTGGELADQLAKSIPILGEIYDAGRNIREMFDGTAEAVAKIGQETKNIEAVTKARQENSDTGADSHSHADDVITRARQRSELIGKTGAERSLIETAHGETNELAGVNKDTDKRIADVKKNDKPKVDELNKQRDKIQIPDTQEISDEYGGSFTDPKSVEAQKKAIADRQAISDQITEIEKSQAKTIGGILQDHRAQVMAIEGATWKDRLQIVKDGAEKIGSEIENAAKKWFEKETKQPGDKTKSADGKEVDPEETARKQLQISNQLMKIKNDELRTGGDLSKQDEARLKIKEEFGQQEEKLHGILADKGSTKKQRDEAQGMLDGLPDAEKNSEDMAAAKAIGPRKATAEAQEAGQLTGLATAAQTTAGVEYHAHLAEIAKRGAAPGGAPHPSTTSPAHGGDKGQQETNLLLQKILQFFQHSNAVMVRV